MRGEVAIGPSIYGVYVIDGSLCSRVYGSYTVEMQLADTTPETGMSIIIDIQCILNTPIEKSFITSYGSTPYT